VNKELENFKCISSSNDQDNELVFICYDNRLLCVDASTAAIISSVELTFNAASVYSKRIKESLNFVVLLTDIGSKNNSY
jgi:hypothetical protein